MAIPRIQQSISPLTLSPLGLDGPSFEGSPSSLRPPQNGISLMSKALAANAIDIDFGYRIQIIRLKARLDKLEYRVDPEQRDAFEKLRTMCRRFDFHAGSPEEVQQNIDRLYQDSLDFEPKEVLAMAEQLHTTIEVAGEIFSGLQVGWKFFYQEMPGGLLKQTHDIRYLKIIKDPESQQIMAFFGGEIIGTGAHKTIKSVQEIGGEALARFTLPAKHELQSQFSDSQIEAAHYDFILETEREWAARTALSGIPNVVGLKKLQYLSRDKICGESQLKTWFVMKRYEGNLRSLILQGSPAPKNRQAMLCCLGVVHGLSQMHAKSFVHSDLKLENVLCKDSEGFLSDFGFLSKEGGPLPFIGNIEYMAPETFFNGSIQYARSQDMFSLGILLLGVSNPGLRQLWNAHVSSLKTSEEYAAAEQIILEHRQNPMGLEEAQYGQRAKSVYDNVHATYLEIHAQLCMELIKINSPLSRLIHRLIAIQPNDRPSIQEAEVVLTEHLAS